MRGFEPQAPNYTSDGVDMKYPTHINGITLLDKCHPLYEVFLNFAIIRVSIILRLDFH